MSDIPHPAKALDMYSNQSPIGSDIALHCFRFCLRQNYQNMNWSKRLYIAFDSLSILFFKIVRNYRRTCLKQLLKGSQILAAEGRLLFILGQIYR